jgi:hypothetical protein
VKNRKDFTRKELLSSRASQNEFKNMADEELDA